MAVTQGTVAWVKVAPLSGFFSVSLAGGGQELFILWFTPALQQPPSVTQRLLWTTQLALVRDALVAKIPITVFHDDQSAFARSIEIGQA